jgi:phage/plasmid-associated DNA primase
MGDEWLYDAPSKTWYHLDKDTNLWLKRETHTGNLRPTARRLLLESANACYESILARPMTDADKKEWQKTKIKQMRAIDTDAYFDRFHKTLVDTFDIHTEQRIKNLFDGKQLTQVFENQPHLFAFRNQVFDTRTQTMRDIDSNDYVHETCGYRLDEATDEAKKEVMGFLWSLFEDGALVNYVLDLLATALCGKRNLHSFVILKGRGGNGKSLFVRLLDNAFGYFFASLKPTTYQVVSRSPDTPNPDLMTIKGRRLVVAPEVPCDIKLREDVIKLFSGQDKITGRKLYQDPE